ncbi:unnamed protein product [Coffea canephora]|uniref:Uncharacterized protein n=1 Tax=Coffea canephora TaxID=49390 RepID=A0A068TXX5_COFCA|nr:unnamed protein product [Coffea canephora]
MCSSLYRSAQCALDGDDAKGSMDVKMVITLPERKKRKYDVVNFSLDYFAKLSCFHFPGGCLSSSLLAVPCSN